MKKIITTILAMTFILSMLPGVAAASAEDGGMHFIFGADAYGATSELDKDGLQTKKAEGKLATVNTDPWRIDGQRYMYTMYAYPSSNTTYGNCLRWRVYKKRYNTGIGAIAILLDVQKTGTFDPSLEYYYESAAYTMNVYLIPESDISTTVRSSLSCSGEGDGNLATFLNGLSADDKVKYGLGNVDMRNADQDSATTAALTETYEIKEKGNYYLMLHFTDSTVSASATGSYYGRLRSFNLTPVETEEPSELESAFDYAYVENYTNTNSASITAYAVYGTDGEVSDTQTIENMPSVTYGSTCEINAPETYTDDESAKTYKFLYWAKGMTMGKKQVVSYSAKIPEYKPHEGVNYLIAVYEEVGAESSEAAAEFYNANGQLLDLTLTEENKLPDLPSMAGYGKAVKWALRNADDTYTEYEEGADASNLSGVFMAKYNDLEKNIAVTVNGGEPTYYAYGDPVPCTTDAENFSYWTKTVNGKTEIVSTKSAYTFNAYEACTVTAVCEGGIDLGKTMRKIILSTFAAGDETAIMAEFIGFEDALEKGIMFGNQKKIAMNTDKSQFTVINDLKGATTVTGYAIVNEDEAIKKITDAEITVGAE